MKIRIMCFLCMLLLIVGLDTIQSSSHRIVIDNFSERYYAIIEIKDSEGDQFFCKLTFYDQKKELFRRDISMFHNETDSSGIQSILIYEDFNFDGIPDIAIKDGGYSCYSIPSYQVYLAEKNNFVHSEEFTVLGQEYCGMFEVDSINKRIHTWTKSGWGWQKKTTFSVIDNIPHLEQEIEIDYYNMIIPFIHLKTTRDYVKEEIIEKADYYFDWEYMYDDIPKFGFRSENNESMVLFILNHVLYFILINEDNKVEVLYSESYFDDGESESFFYYEQDKDCLHFQSDDQLYEIYETENIIGVTIHSSEGIQKINGLKINQFGSIQQLRGYETVINLKERK